MNIMRVLLVSVLFAFPAAHAQEAPLAATSAGAASAPAAAASPAPHAPAPSGQEAAATPVSAPAAQSAVAPGAPAAAMPPAATTPKRTHAPKGSAPKKKNPSTQRHKVAPDMQAGRNPVIEAINLVATVQRDEIRAADSKVAEADWWLDTLERDWIVRRPFGPGLFDSTHWFYVSYRVNGRIIMSWFVDLEKRTVAPIAPPEQPGAR